MLPRTSQASCPRPERFPVHHVFLTEIISMTKPASDTDHPPFGEPPRTLTEDVLQSAEEAVLSNPASVAGMPEQGLPSAPKIADAAVTRAASADKLAQRMAEKPFQSALLAFVAGALLAALVRSAMQRRRD